MPQQQALAPELVQEFVNEAHGNFGRVKELLEQELALLNAAWDRGGKAAAVVALLNEFAAQA